MNKRFRKGIAILVTLTFLMQSVIFTSPAMFSVYAEADQSAVESVIDTDDGMQDATDSETESEGGQPSGEQESLEEESPGDTVEEPAEEKSEDPVEEVQEEPAPTTEPEEVVKQDAESPAKAPTKAANDDGLTVLAFTSDIHNQDDNIARNRLHTWLGNVADIYGPVDVMSFCGDMGAAKANESQFWQYTDAIMDLVDEDVPASVYTTGNHEFFNGNYGSSSDSLAVQNKYIIGDVGLEGDNYIIYCLGSDNWNNYQDNYTQAQIDALTRFLNDPRLDNDTRPIIILTHFPLHWYGSRSGTTRAINVIEALNAASQAGRKIILLWGHNHSVSDENYDQIFQPGDTIEYAKTSGSTATIEFLYAAAGCMSDYEYNGGHSDLVKGKGLVITINDQNQVTMAFHNEAGTDVTEGGAYTEGDPVEATGMSLAPETMSITVGDSGNLTLSFTPANATDKKVTWTSSDTSVATVSGGVVTGVAPGTATITATHVNGGFTDTCAVTVKKAPGSGVTPENGKKYVILAGDEYALTSEGDEVGYSNGSGDQIFHYYGLTGEAFTVGETVTPDHLLWTFETSEDGTGYYIKANTGEYLNGTYAENDEGGSTGTLKLDETKDVWVITGMTAEGAPAGAHILKSTNASATASSDKYLTHGNGDNGGDNTNIFTLRSGDNATAVIFYEYNDDGTAVEDPDDPPLVDPPTPTDGTVYKLVDQFTSGSDYLIVSRNDAGSGYALTNPGGTSGGATMGSSSVTVQNGDIDGDGTADMYISTDAADVVWKATANGERFDITNGSDFLEGKSGDVHIYSSQQYADRGWTYTASQLKHEGGSNTYVVYYDGSAFKATHNSSSDEIYIYEKTETVQGEDPVESVELNKESLTLTEGDSATLTATVKPATAADKSVTWTSSDEAIATVDEHGKVTAVAEGTATITVTTTDGGKTATCEVTVEAAPEPTGDLYKEVSSFEDGREYILGVTKDDGSVYVLSYESGDYASSDTLAVTAGSEEEPASIITDKESVVWTYEGEHQYLAIAGKYFYPSSGNSIRVYRSGRAITYADGAISFETSSSGTQYVTCENGTFGTSAEAEEAATIRLFVKQEGTVHEHTWGEWTVTTPATCSATGVETRICEGCGETETRETAIDENAHAWGEWTVTTPATETEEGVETRVCANDPTHTETQVIPATGHVHSMTKVEAQNATCTEDGNIEYWFCTACGKFFSDEDGTTEITQDETIIPKTDHNWGEWITLVEPTCTEKGVKYHVCSFNAMHMELGDIDPAGHALVKTEARAATCTAEGNIEYWTCSKCGDLFSDEEGTTRITLADTVTPKAAHTWGDWIVKTPATCEATGEEVRTCSVCEEEETREIAVNKDAHTWGEWQVLTNATCTEKGVMVRHCVHNTLHMEVIEIPAAGHKLVKTPAREATCTAAGNSDYWTCGVCGLIFSDADGTNEITIEDTIIPMADHNWSDWAVTTPATCEEAGVETRTCSACDMSETREIAATGHNWGEWTVTKPATETEEGEETRVCANDPVHKETQVIPKLSHTHVTTKVDATASTCEEQGNIEYWVCSGCGKYFADEEATTELSESTVIIPKTGHDWGDWVILIEPTCTEKGHRLRSCTYDTLHTQVEELEPTGHATTHYGAYDATCEQDGNVEYWACSRCEKNYSDEACTTEVSEVVLKAFGHDWSDWVVTKPATCSAAGSEERVCANDPSHKESREIAIDGNAHTWGEWEILVPATCTGKGAMIHHCIYNESHAETVEIPPAGHQWGEWIVVTEPTCTTAGSKTRTCEVCGRVETEEIPVDAEAHDWGDWTVLKAASCGEAGVEFRTCRHNSLHQEFRLTPALSHEMTKVEAKAATCTKAGNVQYYACSNCGKFYSDAAGTKELSTVAVPATGHHMVVTSFKAPTATKTGSETRTCSKCGAKETTEIPRTKLATPAVSTGGAVSSRSFNVSWKTIDGATNYQVAYRKAGATKWTTVWAGNKTSYKISGLTKKGAYQIKVRAYRKSDGTYSSYSSVKYRYLMNGTSVKATSTAKGKLKVTYAKDTSATGYEVVYSTSSKLTNAKTFDAKGAGKVTCTFSGLKSGKTYYVRIRPYKVVDGKKYYGIWSAVKSVKVK